MGWIKKNQRNKLEPQRNSNSKKSKKVANTESKQELAKTQKVGRPSKYDTIDWELVNRLYMAGLTDRQVAVVLQVNVDTIHTWKKEHVEFSDSLKKWKEFADENIELSLYERAMGYSHPDVHISTHEGEVIVTDIIKHYPPDPTSMIFWLKNRQPAKWRDRTELDINQKISISINYNKVDSKDLPPEQVKEILGNAIFD